MEPATPEKATSSGSVGYIKVAAIVVLAAFAWFLAIYSVDSRWLREMREVRGEVRSVRDLVVAQQTVIDGYMTTRQVADEFGVTPADIRDLLDRGLLDADVCCKFSDRWMIPQSYLPHVRGVLAAQGKLKD
jgi:hypothetical protein